MTARKPALHAGLGPDYVADSHLFERLTMIRCGVELTALGCHDHGPGAGGIIARGSRSGEGPRAAAGLLAAGVWEKLSHSDSALQMVWPWSGRPRDEPPFVASAMRTGAAQGKESSEAAGRQGDRVVRLRVDHGEIR